MQDAHINDEFLESYRELDAQRDAIQEKINALKAQHAANYPAQPGAKVRLTWKNGDSETLALEALRINTTTGDISPKFRHVNSDGSLSLASAEIQRGYTIQVTNPVAYPEFYDNEIETE